MIIKIFLFGEKVYICCVIKEQQNLIFQPDSQYDRMSVKNLTRWQRIKFGTVVAIKRVNNKNKKHYEKF